MMHSTGFYLSKRSPEKKRIIRGNFFDELPPALAGGWLKPKEAGFSPMFG